MNIVFCSHCDFKGNSALHVYAVAQALQHRGHDCIMIIPGDLSTAPADQPVKITGYEAVGSSEIRFPNGGGPDVIHVWTPRAHVVEMVRTLLARVECPYVVHMEDNEETIVARELGNSIDIETLKQWPADLVKHVLANPARTNVSVESDFLERADGYSCLTERLLEFGPKYAPACVISPGFDSAFEPRRDQLDDRAHLGIDEDALVVTYCGNVHVSNLSDMRSLYAGLALVGRRRKKDVLLLRTGWDQTLFHTDATRGLTVRHFGFVARNWLPQLISAADLLIQPGRVDDFNAYRFPSKVPDYLVSGKPTILPNTNIGLRLVDGVQTVKLAVGDATEIADRVERLADAPQLRKNVGEAGREFALRELTWERAAEHLEALYLTVRLELGRSKSEPIVGGRGCRQTPVKGRFPVDLVALLPSGFYLGSSDWERLRDAGVAFTLSMDETQQPAPTDPPVPAACLSRVLSYAKRRQEESRAGSDYMICAARELAAAKDGDAWSSLVLAPGPTLKYASVSAYAQWLRCAVRLALARPAEARSVFIAGLGPVSADALSGDQRAQAILRATRAAVVQGVSEFIRGATIQDEADFLDLTIYRAGSK